MTLRQFRCALSGHLFVTRHPQGAVFEQCFLCDYVKGHGWSTRGLAAPTPSTGKLRQRIFGGRITPIRRQG